MNDADRFRLLYGPYRPPRFRVDGFLRCAVRGKVRVVGITEGPISWPVRRQPDALGRRFLIVCGGLVQALQRESELAVAHWWGVTPQTVWTWRKALGVPAHTDGTRQLHRDWMPERMDEAAVEKRAQALRSPERAAKIAAARKGKRHTAETKAKVGAASRGRKPSAEARQKMSDAQRGTNFSPRPGPYERLEPSSRIPAAVRHQRMDRHDLTASQGKLLSKALFPHLNCLVRLTRRMQLADAMQPARSSFFQRSVGTVDARRKGT